MQSVTYFLVDCSRCRYLILIATGCIPDLLHHLDRLLNRHIPRICNLTNKRHIGRDECMSEPMWLNCYDYATIVDTTRHMSLSRSRVTVSYDLRGVLWPL